MNPPSSYLVLLLRVKNQIIWTKSCALLHNLSGCQQQPDTPPSPPASEHSRHGASTSVSDGISPMPPGSEHGRLKLECASYATASGYLQIGGRGKFVPWSDWMILGMPKMVMNCDKARTTALVAMKRCWLRFLTWFACYLACMA